MLPRVTFAVATLIGGGPLGAGAWEAQLAAVTITRKHTAKPFALVR
jgi:hypothetical protein